jgi:hypothetical protein
MTARFFFNVVIASPTQSGAAIHLEFRWMATSPLDGLGALSLSKRLRSSP